ncbi:MAG: hypothetical protein QN778_03275, partial [Nitrososphaeraceae archaeon]|nr:hypothetical protein [Nitrososphaeraceae archaeon]
GYDPTYIGNYMRIVESQSAVQNWIEEKNVYTELIEPLKTRIQTIKEFLSLNSTNKFRKS